MEEMEFGRLLRSRDPRSDDAYGQGGQAEKNAEYREVLSRAESVSTSCSSLLRSRELAKNEPLPDFLDT